MIPRYRDEEIKNIWSTDNKLNTWLTVEIAHIESLNSMITDKTITQEETDEIKKHAKVNKERWLEIEKETKHDFQAFVQMLEESIPSNAGRWIHYGLTSSDVLDTTNIILCKKSLSVIAKRVACLISSLEKKTKSSEAKSRILSRTHGKAAEIQTYRDVFKRWLDQVRRSYDLIVFTNSRISWGKMSGPSGNYTTTNTVCEKVALNSLGLNPIRSSQIISRDIFLDYFYCILKLMISLEKIAMDIRLYSIEEVNEMNEGFTESQKGSSSMPHKKNPISTENICGLSRLYKSYFQTAVDNCYSFWERDISHSSSERIIFKDGAHIAAFTAQRLQNVIDNLVLNTEVALENCVKKENKLASQSTLNDLIKSGLSRKESHDISQLKSN